MFRVLLAGTLRRAAAEDATAEAFARAFANWATVAEHPNPRAWVLRVAWNYYRSSWRKWEAVGGGGAGAGAGGPGLGKAAGTIRSQLFRARASLRAALDQDPGPEERP